MSLYLIFCLCASEFGEQPLFLQSGEPCLFALVLKSSLVQSAAAASPSCPSDWGSSVGRSGVSAWNRHVTTTWMHLRPKNRYAQLKA